jgi:hypothetical protein
MMSQEIPTLIIYKDFHVLDKLQFIENIHFPVLPLLQINDQLILTLDI